MKYAYAITPSYRQKSEEEGFNLVEAAIVLGVVGLVIGGIWVAASAVTEAQRLSNAITQISQIVSNTKNLFHSTTVSNIEISDAQNPQLLTAIFPADTIISGAPVNPWGREYRVYIDNSDIGVYISLPNVSTCANLGPRLYAAFKNELGGNSIPGISTSENNIDVSSAETSAAACQNQYDLDETGTILMYVKR